MTKVILAWKTLLLQHLELGKPLQEVAGLMRIGMDRIIQERKADPEFDARLQAFADRPSRRPSW